MSNAPYRIFIGYDHRQPISYNVLQHSIIARTSKPVSITPLKIDTLPIERMGLTPFTFSRWLVPWLCDYAGWALFIDSDMLVMDDIIELMDMADDRYALMATKNPDPKLAFEWPSVMLWNCGHEANKVVDPAFVQLKSNNPYKLGWLGGYESALVGTLPREWNHLVGYDEPREDAKLAHYTMGAPIFPETEASEYREPFLEEHKMMNSAAPWNQLMARSKHATHLPDGQILPHFHPAVLEYKKQQGLEAVPE